MAGVYLPQTGYARRDTEAPILPPVVLRCLLHGKWSRSDETEVAFQHIEELRQLIQAPFAKKGADAGDAWVIRHFECRPRPFILFQKVVFSGFSIHDHRTEFVKREGSSTEAGALLFEDDRAF